MTDAALDREIAAALNVDLSPAFMARVRQRVADAPAPLGPPWSWRAVAAAMAAALTLALVVWRSDHDAGRSAQDLGVIPSQAIVPLTGAIPGTPQPSASSDATRSRLPGGFRIHGPHTLLAKGRDRARETATRSVHTEPEVLISTNEARAFRDLIESLRDGRIDPASLPPDLPPLAEITIPPITITPVTASTIEGGQQ